MCDLLKSAYPLIKTVIRPIIKTAIVIISEDSLISGINIYNNKGIKFKTPVR